MLFLISGESGYNTAGRDYTNGTVIRDVNVA